MQIESGLGASSCQFEHFCLYSASVLQQKNVFIQFVGYDLLLIESCIFSHIPFLLCSIVGGIGVTFIEPVNYSSFFDRDTVYGNADDFERLAVCSMYFCTENGFSVIYIQQQEIA